MSIFKEDSTIIGAFPIPILLQNLNRDFTEEENKFIENQKKLTKKNLGNFSSVEKFILEKKEMQKLKIDILEGINNFFQNIVCPKEKIFPYLTQSWLNWTSKNEYHHKHSHENSFISGVFYVDVDEKKDSISFFNDQHQTIRINNDPRKNNAFNTNFINITVKKNLLILFPSSLSHAVLIKDSENTRTSLAFNTFIKGTWGNKEELTEITV